MGYRRIRCRRWRRRRMGLSGWGLRWGWCGSTGMGFRCSTGTRRRRCRGTMCTAFWPPRMGRCGLEPARGWRGGRTEASLHSQLKTACQGMGFARWRRPRTACCGFGRMRGWRGGMGSGLPPIMPTTGCKAERSACSQRTGTENFGRPRRKGSSVGRRIAGTDRSIRESFPTPVRSFLRLPRLERWRWPARTLRRS